MGKHEQQEQHTQVVHMPQDSDPSRGASFALQQGAVTYVTGSTLCFAYLRDLLVTRLEDVLLPSELYYVIIDEVDQVLVDQARSSHRLSGKAGTEWTTAVQEDIRTATAVTAGLVTAQWQVCSHTGSCPHVFAVQVSGVSLVVEVPIGERAVAMELDSGIRTAEGHCR